MKRIPLGPVPSDPTRKLDWCIEAIQRIAAASGEADPNEYAQAYTLSNVSESRTLDATGATLAQLRQVLATFLLDHQNGGTKRAT